MADKQIALIACARTDGSDKVAADMGEAVLGACDFCGIELWVAPTTQKLLERADLDCYLACNPHAHKGIVSSVSKGIVPQPVYAPGAFARNTFDDKRRRKVLEEQGFEEFKP